jgi:hypothetical protein
MADDAERFFLENGQLRLGIDLSTGGGVFYFSDSDGENFLSSQTKARYMQQSYYGAVDGTVWKGKQWVWNPVQGRAVASSNLKVLTFKKSPEAIYVKSIPVHWATGTSMSDCIMEQWIVLKARIAHIRYKFTYTGSVNHPIKWQEMPSIFLDPKYSRLSFYSGKSPWSNGELESFIPGWPNKTFGLTESWAAYLDREGVGLGVMVPRIKSLTAYRYVAKKNLGDNSEDCSYFAPMKKIAIKKGVAIMYDVFLTVGKVEDIRKRFSELHQNTKLEEGPE